MFKADIVSVKMLPDEDSVVKERLRCLLQLAIAIGRREGLLGKEILPKVTESKTFMKRRR